MEQIAKPSYLEDRLSIADLMTGWIHRDLGEWDQLRSLFHPDATIDITWFTGKAGDFVVYPTKGSDLEKTIKAKGQTWLKA